MVVGIGRLEATKYVSACFFFFFVVTDGKIAKLFFVTKQQRMEKTEHWHLNEIALNLKLFRISGIWDVNCSKLNLMNCEIEKLNY